MRLKRFKTEEKHYDYINYKSLNLNESNDSDIIIESKIELLANISKNWNKKLKDEYYNIKSLYKYDVDELKNIREKYIIKKDEKDVKKREKKTSINKKNDMDNKDKNIINSTLFDSVAELQMKYGSNEAIKEIYINENKIYIDLLCDTDITQSVIDYNGYEIVYNKICDLPVLNEDIDLQDKLVEQSIFMYKNLFN